MNEAYVSFASALLDMAKEEGKVAEYKTALNGVLDTLNSNLSLSNALNSYALPKNTIFSILDKVWGNASLRSLVPFLKVLCDHHSLPHLTDITILYDELADEALGVKEGICYSVAPLDAASIQKIEKSLSEYLKCRVSLKNRVDKGLIGGIKVAIDGKVFDDSIESKIETLQNSLLKKEGFVL